jgi:hypothetical protein
VPASAAAPSQIFEGTLTLSNPTSSGSFRLLRDDEKIDTGTDSQWHLASFSFQFVQNGSYLTPIEQGLVITGSSAWNYIVDPGRGTGFGCLLRTWTKWMWNPSSATRY